MPLKIYPRQIPSRRRGMKRWIKANTGLIPKAQLPLHWSRLLLCTGESWSGRRSHLPRLLLRAEDDCTDGYRDHVKGNGQWPDVQISQWCVGHQQERIAAIRPSNVSCAVVNLLFFISSPPCYRSALWIFPEIQHFPAFSADTIR